MRQRYGTGGSPSASEEVRDGKSIKLTSEWRRYSVTFVTNTLAGKTFGINNDDYLQLGFMNMWRTNYATSFEGGESAETYGGAGNVDFAQIQLNTGESPLLFQPRSFSDELRLCQRYYEKSMGYARYPGMSVDEQISAGLAISATDMLTSVMYKVNKRSNYLTS